MLCHDELNLRRLRGILELGNRIESTRTKIKEQSFQTTHLTENTDVYANNSFDQSDQYNVTDFVLWKL